MPSSPRRPRLSKPRIAAVLLAIAAVLGSPLAVPAAASATATAQVMVNTQRMSGPSLNTTQVGWYTAGSSITLVCYDRGESVQGYFSKYVGNGGWDNLWYQVSDGYFVADIDIQTWTDDAVTAPCAAPQPSSPPSTAPKPAPAPVAPAPKKPAPSAPNPSPQSSPSTSSSGGASGASCYGQSCDGLNPANTNCTQDARSIQSEDAIAGSVDYGLLELRYSPKCHSNWVRFTPWGGIRSFLQDILAKGEVDGSPWIWRLGVANSLRGYAGESSPLLPTITNWTYMVTADGTTCSSIGLYEYGDGPSGGIPGDFETDPLGTYNAPCIS